MSMTVQEPGTCSTLFQTINNSACNTAQWVGRIVHRIGSEVAEYAQKTIEYAKPHFNNFRTFLSENRGPIIIAAIAAALGATAYAVISSVFSSKATPPGERRDAIAIPEARV